MLRSKGHAEYQITPIANWLHEMAIVQWNEVNQAKRSHWGQNVMHSLHVYTETKLIVHNSKKQKSERSKGHAGVKSSGTVSNVLHEVSSSKKWGQKGKENSGCG